MLPKKSLFSLKLIAFSLLVFCGSLSVSANSSSKIVALKVSKEPTLAELNQTFSDLFLEVYRKDKCESNVIRLFDGLKQKYPSLQESDFKVLLIFPDGGIHQNSVFTGGTPRYRHILPPGWISVGWMYHVILEYKGQTLDYDYTRTPQILSTADYVEKMFFTKQRPGYEVTPWELNVVYSSISSWRETLQMKINEYDWEAAENVPLDTLRANYV